MEKYINILASLIAIGTFIYSILNYNVYVFLICIFFILFFITFKFIFSSNKCKFTLYRYVKYVFAKKKHYKLELRETYYEFVDRTNMLHKRKFIIKSCINDLEFFTDKYRWSKISNCIVKPKIQNQLLVHEWEEHGWKFYSIKLDRSYAKNETVDVLVSIDNLVDEKMESKPFLSTGIYEKTKYLKMMIKFNPILRPYEIKIRIYKDPINGSPCIEEELPYDYDKSEILFEQKYPICGYRYMIVWAFR